MITQDRSQMTHELEMLIRQYVNLMSCTLKGRTQETLPDRILQTIHYLMDELYDCTGDPETRQKSDCCISDETFAALTNKDNEYLHTSVLDELEFETEYVSLVDVMDEMIMDGSVRAARKGWDNTMNQEYIEQVPFAGVTKVYNTSRVHAGETPNDKPRSYFKKVVHTYEPTQEDLIAEDWYFIN